MIPAIPLTPEERQRWHAHATAEPDAQWSSNCVLRLLEALDSAHADALETVREKLVTIRIPHKHDSLDDYHGGKQHAMDEAIQVVTRLMPVKP